MTRPGQYLAHPDAPSVSLLPDRLPTAPAVLAILDLLTWPETCAACGCLCRPDERCPGCRAAQAVAS